MKDSNKHRRMQPLGFESFYPDGTTGSDRVYKTTVMLNIMNGDGAAAALMTTLFDIDRLNTGEEEGFWLQYNVREIRRLSNLSAAEQRRARAVLGNLQLVAFAVSDTTGDVKFLINHPLFREMIEKEIGMSIQDGSK